MATVPSTLERNFPGLVAKIRSRECVLVLGPRICAPVELHPEVISVDAFLRDRLLEELDVHDRAHIDLHEAIARYQKQRSPAALRSAVQSAAAEFDPYTTELHRNLASLPFRLVLSATPDRMMANAFRGQDKSGVQEGYYDFSGAGSGSAPLRDPGTDTPIVYSLFGRYDHPESMVLDEKNLLDYLVCVTRLAPAIPDQVRAILAQPSTLFMFVGFGFTNWWLRFLLKVLDVIGVENRMVSHAVEGSVADAGLSPDSKDFFQSVGIDIHSADWNAFAQELAARFRSDVQATTVTPPIVDKGSSAPLVFLSYSGADEKQVDSLRAGLQKRGVAVWQDHQNLQAGQNWEVKIAQIIDRCDYFVLVQTKNMDDGMQHGRDGYYNWELRCALRTQDKKPLDYGFLIPVTFGECGPLPSQLDKIHKIAVDDETGIDNLARAVLTSYDALISTSPLRASA